LDRLLIDIETNGAIQPEEAVRQSARILVEQLSVFAALEGGHDALHAFSGRTPQLDPILLRPVDDLRADSPLGQLFEGRKHLLHR
jgi:DNA-directed RNA polymerase subunit alpha